MANTAEVREAIERIFSRLFSLVDFYGGFLEKRLQKATDRGAIPWRIARYERIINPKLHIFPTPAFRYVEPRTFEKHCYYYANYCNCIALEELCSMLNKGEIIPPKTVAITIDSGFVDTRLAAAILAKYKLPATFFIYTDMIGTGRQFWYDSLMYVALLMHTAKISYADFAFVSKYFDITELEADADLETLIDQTSALISILANVTPEERTQALEDIGKIVNQLGGITAERAFLTWEEVAEIHRAGIILGTHGHNYSIITSMDDSQISSQLADSRKRAREHGLELSSVYAPPDGLVSDINLSQLKKNGVDFCVGLEEHYLPTLPTNHAVILSRTPVFQAASLGIDMLAALLWRKAKFNQEPIL